MHIRTCLFVSFLFVAILSLPVRCETLEEALKNYGLNNENANMQVTSYGILNSSDAFAIAYYEDDGSGLLGDSIYIDYFDRNSNSWKKRFFSKSSLDEFNPCSHTGSVVYVKDSDRYLYVVTHLNPSAGCTFVFNKTLDFVGELYGWPVAVFKNGNVIFQHSQRHFAPTHYVEMSVFSPHTKRVQKIYPPEPFSTVRKQQVQKVHSQYEEKGDEWCRQMNYSCDPELFDSTLRDCLVDDATGAALTVVTFKDASNPPNSTDMVTVYRDVQMGSSAGFRELRLEDLSKRFGSLPLSDYLHPGVMKRLFQE